MENRQMTVRLDDETFGILKAYADKHIITKPVDAIRHLIQNRGRLIQGESEVNQVNQKVNRSDSDSESKRIKDVNQVGESEKVNQIDSAVIQGILVRLEAVEGRLPGKESVMKWNQATQDGKYGRNVSRELREALVEGKWDTTFLEAPVLEGGFPGIKARLKALEERVEGELGALAMERRVEAALQRPMKEAAAWIQEEVMYLKQAIKMTKSRLKLLEHHTLGLPLVDPEPVEGSEVAAEVPAAGRLLDGVEHNEFPGGAS